MVKLRILRFCLNTSLSPTYYNVCHYLRAKGWKRTYLPFMAHFSEKNFQFNSDAAECLEFKHSLAALVTKFCPHVMPLTYRINDLNWFSVLNEIAQEHYEEEPVWILKPALLNNGQHIKLFNTPAQIEQHFLSSKRLGGDHVLQRYIKHPHLLKGPKFGHKYSIRMFVLLTNYAGAYLYPEGYFNIGLQPYQPHDFSDLRAHLTNEHLSEEELNVVQIRTRQYELFKPFYPQIKNSISAVIQGLKQVYPQAFICQQHKTLAIFGFDFVVDHQLKVWLLETNHAPCFPISPDHPIQNTLYYEFWQALITSFIIPIALEQDPGSTQHQAFERI